MDGEKCTDGDFVLRSLNGSKMVCMWAGSCKQPCRRTAATRASSLVLEERWSFVNWNLSALPKTWNSMFVSLSRLCCTSATSATLPCSAIVVFAFTTQTQSDTKRLGTANTKPDANPSIFYADVFKSTRTNIEVDGAAGFEAAEFLNYQRDSINMGVARACTGCLCLLLALLW